MNVLVLGGTQFVGRHVVEAMCAAGHSVSVLNRGITPDALPGSVERLRGDRDRGASGLRALKDRTWDACIDVSGYTPRQVRSSAETLTDKVDRYVFFSSVSVYGDPLQTPVTEAFRRLPPTYEDVAEIDAATYGSLKVACEDILQQLYGERCALLRPQIAAGPYDPIDRYSYWVRRAGQPGEILAPGDGTDHLQYIDVRDVARFAMNVIENDMSGSFNLSGPRLTWSYFLNVLGAKNVVWVSASIIKAAGVTEFELPLFRPDGGPRSSLMHVSNKRAMDAGLALTAPVVTINDTRAWLRESDDLAPAFTREREAELIRIAREQAPE